MICASLTEKSAELMVKAAGRTKADLVEVRLDFMKSQLDVEKLAKIKKPVIATCMPSWEGGRFTGSEKERIELLERALPFASYVTIELNTKPLYRSRIIQEARKKRVKAIVAYHDHKKTPKKSRIKAIISRELRLGDIAKVAYTPKTSGDVLALLNALLEKKPGMKVIALSMGKLGRVTRILGPLMGSYLTYGSVSKGKKAGSGQLTVDELIKINAILNTH